MRIYLHTTPNQEIVPFNYQQRLSGVFYTWLGEKNEEHGRMSLYSYSWLKKGRITEGGYEFPNGATWFISFHSEETLKKLMKSILNQPQMFNGLTVCNITIEDTPTLSKRTLFYLGSPVYIQKHTPDLQNNTQYTFEDIESDEMLTQTLLRKMELAGMQKDETLRIMFDRSYPNKKTKMVSYKGIYLRSSLCPVIIEGKPESKSFAWNVGIGNSTGIGFGSIY